jgi:hypothetical protein
VTNHSLPDAIRNILKKLFEWAGQAYLEELKNIGSKTDQFIGFSVMDEEVEKYLPILSEFFLSDQNKSKINFYTDDHLKRSSPPPSPEDQLHWGLEHLLLWAGACLAARIDAPSADSIIEKFWGDFGSPAKRIAYLPICGCYMEPHGDFYKPFPLMPDVILRNLKINEFTHFKNESHGIRNFPDPKPIFFGPLMIEVLAPPVERDEEFKACLAKFRVLMRGLFGAPAMLPVFVHGTRSAWSPFVFDSATFPKMDLSTVRDHKLSDMELRAFKMRWANIQLPDPERSNITVARLDRSEARDAWQDTVVDLCIALESLLPSAESEMTYTYSTWIAALLGKDHEERKQIYDLMRWIYKVRGSLVHGDTVKNLFKDVSNQEFERRIGEFKRFVQQTFRLMLLNPGIRVRAGLTDKLLGSPDELIRSPMEILKTSS